MTDINLKTLSPDTSLPTTGFLFGADSQASTNPSVYGVTTAITAILGNAASSDALVFNSDTTFSRGAIRNFRFGAADAATALAQTLSVQSVVAGTSSTAGADFTLTGSQNTGSGLAGNLIVSTGFSNTVGTATVTITIATPGVITWTAHGLVTGSPVVFTTTGALPTGITAGTTYFAITSSTLGVNTFQIATSAANAAAGTAITTSGTQSGVHTGTTSATVQSPLMTTTTFGPSGLTGSQTTPVLDLAQTWNTSGNATGLKLNVTNVASGASALLMDLQVGGTSQFKVSKAGNITVPNGASINGTGSTIIISSGFAVTGQTFSNSFVNGTSSGLTTKAGTYIGFTPVNYYDAPDVILLRDAANILALKNSTNAQEFRVYETTTGSIYKAILGNRQLIKISGASFDNGAGAQAGTITNSPTVGNPTKWIPIDDNGTTRYIPAW